MSNIKVKNMQAGDPGVGFTLDLNSADDLVATNPLTVTVKVTEVNSRHQSTNKIHDYSITISPPLTMDDELVFVLPYCSTDYDNDNSINVKITLSQGTIESYCKAEDYTVPANKLSSTNGVVSLAINKNEQFTSLPS